MSDNRKYYYLKLKENFYNSETMVILESMQDGLLYSNLLLKMYLMSLKSGGILMLNDHLPHTPHREAVRLSAVLHLPWQRRQLWNLPAAHLI